LKKDVTGKERLPKHDRLAAIFMRGIVAGERGADALLQAIFHKLFLPTRPGMGYEPKQF
jgi:hypothetical protein